MERTRARPGRVLVLLSATVAVLLMWSVSRVQQVPTFPRSDALPEQLPPLTAHALEHADAWEAWSWVQHHGRHCRNKCTDGRTRYVCRMRSSRWAVVVLGVTERLITAFTTDARYAWEVIDNCRGPHPRYAR